MNRYLRRFVTYDDFQDYIDGNISSDLPVFPNVSIVKESIPYEVIFIPMLEEPEQ